VLDLDLDQFKEINDTIGHHYSEEMLREVAARLADQRRGDDLLARLGGDEFAILLSPCGSERAEETAANIIKSIKRPLTLKGLQVQVGPSIGIARYPDDSTDTGKLLQKAEIAMYQAKTLRRGWTWYSQYDDRFSVRRLRLLGELPRALSKEELVVYYQPKIDLTIGTVVGVEALVRWQHPDLGMIAPDEFIELTEVSGLVTELTRQVLTRSVQQLTIWDEAGIHLDVAVNLSVRDFHDEGLVSFIVEALQTHNVAPERLMLEITESQVVDDVELATEVLLELSSLGIKTSIDDFGTGYSSLTHLRQLPVAEIKIDRSFVGQMATNHNDAVIVRSIVELGHNLDLEVVAEGVEDEWTLDNLRALGCDRAQGYFFQRPVPGSEIPEFVHAVAAVPR
jgi:diguanylate cyclase (GGDEF)-like protein